MLAEYERHLNFYKNYWFADFSKQVANGRWGERDIWGDHRLAEAFMQKYWLPKRMNSDTITKIKIFT
jgi:hypothetical protein